MKKRWLNDSSLYLVIVDSILLFILIYNTESFILINLIVESVFYFKNLSAYNNSPI